MDCIESIIANSILEKINNDKNNAMLYIEMSHSLLRIFFKDDIYSILWVYYYLMIKDSSYCNEYEMSLTQEGFLISDVYPLKSLMNTLKYL